MGYGNSDLEEIPFVDLKKEIERRQKCMNEGLCIYCKHPLTSHTCKFADNKVAYFDLMVVGESHD